MSYENTSHTHTYEEFAMYTYMFQGSLSFHVNIHVFVWKGRECVSYLGKEGRRLVYMSVYTHMCMYIQVLTTVHWLEW